MKSKSLIEIRSEINSQGIQPIYQLYQVKTPRGVMLHVIFNMLHSLSMKEAQTTNDTDAKEILMYQQTIFELACEEEVKNFPSYSEQRNQ